MSSKYKDKDSGIVLSFNAQWVSWAHTIVAYSMCCLSSSVLPCALTPAAALLSRVYRADGPLLQPLSSAPSSSVSTFTTTRSSRMNSTATRKNGSPPYPRRLVIDSRSVQSSCSSSPLHQVRICGVQDFKVIVTDTEMQDPDSHSSDFGTFSPGSLARSSQASLLPWVSCER